MADRFVGIDRLTTPVMKSGTVTQSDTVDLEQPLKGVHVNTSGVIRGILMGDSSPKDYTVVAGMPYPYRFKRIYNTGTTATFIPFD